MTKITIDSTKVARLRLNSQVLGLKNYLLKGCLLGPGFYTNFKVSLCWTSNGEYFLEK